MSDLCALSATALLDGYRRHELSPVEVTHAVLARIEKLNPVLLIALWRCLEDGVMPQGAIR